MKTYRYYYLFIIVGILAVSCEKDSGDEPINWALKIPVIQSFVDDVNTDSLVKLVRELSGEDSVVVGGVKTIIKHRISNNNNDLAADYIKEKLGNYDLTITDNIYREGEGLQGRNITATQNGVKNSNAYYIICAHYDAVPDYAADDNASGVAAVLEAARIFSENDFGYSIIYALWDEEELGLIGSRYYAQDAASEGMNILGVINLDMIGYDSNDDSHFDIHINDNPVTIELKDSLISVVNTYDFNLVPNVINPGTTRSDHASFWNENYGAVLFGESFFGGDFNPEYHEPTDRIDIFNIPYFVELSKLSVAITASLANPE